jgi:ABC-type transport system involved in multi-copper enzyme maturation permease subunit
VNPILVIAADSVRALLHQRLLVAFMLATLGLMLMLSVGSAGFNRAGRESAQVGQPPENAVASGIEKMSEADRRKVREGVEAAGALFQALYYGAASFGGSLVALFVFCTAISTEIRKGTIKLTLSKPVSRAQFLLGKCLGGVGVLIGYWTLASAALLMFAQSQQITLAPIVLYAPWLGFCADLMLGSVGLVLSLLMHPLVAAVVAYFASASLWSPPNPLYVLLPSYERYHVLGAILQGTLMSRTEVLWLTLYAVDVSAIMLLLALWRFRTKELT